MNRISPWFIFVAGFGLSLIFCALGAAFYGLVVGL
jgi:hypothetical protein